MRTFISIDMPEVVRSEIEKIQDVLPEFFGKKTERDNLHLTLKFLGEIDEEKVKEVKEKLSEIKFSKFEVEIDSMGIFSENFFRIIWLHLKNCNELQGEIDEKLKNLFEKERRFMSHLTIARVKKIKDKKRFLNELKKIKIPKIAFQVNEFKLKKSKLTPKGPIYETLDEYALD